MPAQHPTRNRLLAALSPAEQDRLFPDLAMSVPLGAVLHKAGEQPGYAYFPTTCIVSLLHILADGNCAEIALVGNEGVVGIEVFMGGDTFSQTLVQSAGRVYRLKKQRLRDAFERSAALRRLLLRYSRALLMQIAQTAVCNRHHSVEQQLCRWLLLSFDRLECEEMVVTQELIANMLGVRREGVTEAAGKLQKAGLIHYHRGHIVMLDRRRLEAQACECYTALRNELECLPPRACGGPAIVQRRPPPADQR